MPKPTVSICIPAYRADKYLEQALRSVAEQTFSDWELIVTEDGSKDRSEDIVRAFAATVKQRVVYNRHEVNQGLPATRNTGITAAQGEWIAFLDADDFWSPDHLALLVARSSEGPCDLVFSGTLWFEDGTGKVLSESSPTAQDLENLPVALYTGKLSVLPSSVMVRRRCFEEYGPVSSEFPRVNDTEYWLRVLRNGGQIAYSGGVTCRYRKHPNAMSQRVADMLEESAHLCERYADWGAIPRVLTRTRPSSLYRWAARSLLPDHPREAAQILQRAVRLDPLNPKNLGLWAKSLLRLRRSHA